MRRFITALLVAGLSLLPTSCTKNAATGRSQFVVLDVQREIALGEQAAPQFLNENGGDIPSNEIRQYVSEIGFRLARSSERPELPWEFHVLDSGVINAFALPGGKVFFSRGLLAKMDNEAQVAAVMGHEVGHVTAKHIGEQMGQAIIVQGIATGLGVAGQVSDNSYLQVLGAGAQVGGGLYLLKFGRDQESEADRLGIRYMTANGYNPVGMMQVMEILKKESGGGGAAEFLSTHPDPGRRRDEAERLIIEKYPDYKDPARYTFNHDRFNAVVVNGLKRLPAPRHGSKRADGTIENRGLPPALAKALELHKGCLCHPQQLVPSFAVEAKDVR